MAVANASVDEGGESVDGSCGVPLQDEIILGLNALPARIAVVSGQFKVLLYAERCAAAAADPATPCKMDEDLVPCETDFYCTTTCALWSLFTSDERPTSSCSVFSRFDGYPMDTEPCDEACLLPEIRTLSWPSLSDRNMFSIYLINGAPARGTGSPGVPVQLVGSDCPDDWAPIEGIEHTTVYGDLMAMTLTLKPENWKKVIANHQPGGVIRIVHRDPTNPVGGRMREQLYALAYAPSEGKLEILTAPTDMALHPTVREVAERVRSLPTGPIIGGNLFVNPIIAVFFNKEWAFLMDVVRSSHFTIDRLVILSKGAGLSRALSAVEATTRLGLKGIHLYHGLRNVQDLPFRERLEELESSGALALTIIESSVSESSNVGVPNKQRESQELREEVKLSVVYLPW
eukprot:CAMPEP_0198206228 /NCGR_PEP_ID=MMETSP1445-20131203/9767_1 /TAXON_ID=36898 /ORGANISM="Pyramimonas sp., Strain CCMP2087" /LENGTH=401 /DNA_ID=CAMNT_0043878841 /DNA_START=154 /DNA_END=1358 /DNA_ORIENTATION=+